MKLIKITQETLAEKWDSLKEALKSDTSPLAVKDEEHFNYIYNALLTDEMQAWVYVDENQVPVLLTITTFVKEPGSKSTNLLIYFFSGFNNFNIDHILDGFKTIRRFALKHNCAKIIAYTNIPKVVEIANKVGFSASYVLLEKEV